MDADGQNPLTVHKPQRGRRGVHIVCPKPTYVENILTQETETPGQTIFLVVQSNKMLKVLQENH